MAIVTVALDRLAISLADGVFECRHTLLLRSSRPGHVKDLFLQNCAVQIIHAIAERYLRQGQTKADPVSGEMVDVIEINAAAEARFMWARTVVCGSKANGINPVNPPVSSCNSRSWRK